MPYELFIAKRYLKSKQKQKYISLITFISIGGVFVGVTALIIVLAIMNGFEVDLRSKILGINSHILIEPEEGKGIENYQEIVSIVEKEPGVTEAAPHLVEKAMLSLDGFVDGIQVRGIQKKELSVTRLSEYIEKGNLNFDSQGLLFPGILLGTDLADNVGATVGDILILASPKTSLITGGVMAPRLAKFQVIGIFKTGYFEYDTTVGYITLVEAQKFFRLKDQVTGIEVKLEDIYAASNIKKELQKKLQGQNVEVKDWMELNKSLFSALKLEKTAMFVVLTLAVTVAAFNIIGTLVMVVLEKKREIGILKALGATSKSILTIFMVEGILIGIVGTFLGNVVGIGICYFLEKVKFSWLILQIGKLPEELAPIWKPIQGGLEAISDVVDKVPVQMQASDLVLISAAAILITISATLYPAWQASRLDPVKAIRSI